MNNSDSSNLSPKYPLNLELLERLADPHSDEAQQAAHFNATAGAAGYTAIYEALAEGHTIDGIIGSINSGAGKSAMDDLILELSKVRLLALVFITGGIKELLIGESEYSDSVVYLFTREQYLQEFLDRNTQTPFRQSAEITMRDLCMKVFPNKQFGIYINSGNGIFEAELPPIIIDIISNFYAPDTGIEK